MMDDEGEITMDGCVAGASEAADWRELLIVSNIIAVFPKVVDLFRGAGASFILASVEIESCSEASSLSLSI